MIAARRRLSEYRTAERSRDGCANRELPDETHVLPPLVDVGALC